MVRFILQTALVLAVVVLPIHSSAYSPSLKDLDPRKPDRVKDAARDLDSEVRELGRNIDRERLKLLPDPEKKLSETAYFSYKAHVENRQGRVREVQLRKGDFHFELVHPLLPKVSIESVAFYFDAYVPADMAAVTFGHKVYVKGPYDADNPQLTRLIAHELTHVGQYDYLGGEKEFAQRYFGQISKATRENILKGNLNVKYLHDDLDLEKEANSYESLVPDYDYRKFNVDSKRLEGLNKKQLKEKLEHMSADELGASLMQIDGPTLKVGLIHLDGPTLKVAVNKMDMPTLCEAMMRVDGDTLTEILKRLHPTKRKFIMRRVDDATRAEIEKRKEHWRR